MKWNVKLPGVFWADKPEDLAAAGFAASAVGFWGVLEATHGDIRAGVFTSDLLNSLSSVASENLEKYLQHRFNKIKSAAAHFESPSALMQVKYIWL